MLRHAVTHVTKIRNNRCVTEV